MDRIEKLCSYLDRCLTFADVGCDHGYCTRYMLENGMCKSAYISDISGKSLSKAEKLLKKYIEDGKVVAVCCDGLEEIPPESEQVLIAGMGGEEIIRILENSFIPEKFLFQPMKSARALREYLLARSAQISYDGVFESGGKFYFVIKGGKHGETEAYSEAELEFGKDLNSAAARALIESELRKNKGYAERLLNGRNRAVISERIAFLERILKNEN